MVNIGSMIDMSNFDFEDDKESKIKKFPTVLEKETTRVYRENIYKGVKFGEVWRSTNRKTNAYYLFLVVATGDNQIAQGYKIYDKSLNQSDYTVKIEVENDDFTAYIDIMRPQWVSIEHLDEKICYLNEKTLYDIYSKLSSILRIPPEIKTKYDTKIKEFNNEIGLLKKKIKEWETEYDILNREYKNQNKAVGRNRGLKEKAEDRIKHLEETVKSQEDNIAALNKAIEEKDGQIKRNIAYIEELGSKPKESQDKSKLKTLAAKYAAQARKIQHLERLLEEENNRKDIKANDDKIVENIMLKGQIELLKQMLGMPNSLTEHKKEEVKEKDTKMDKFDKKEWYEKNKEKMRQYKKEWYEKHKEEIKRKRRERYKNNKK